MSPGKWAGLLSVEGDPLVDLATEGASESGHEDGGGVHEPAWGDGGNFATNKLLNR